MTYILPIEEQQLAVKSIRKFLKSEIRLFARLYIDRFASPPNANVVLMTFLVSLGNGSSARMGSLK